MKIRNKKSGLLKNQKSRSLNYFVPIYKFPDTKSLISPQKTKKKNTMSNTTRKATTSSNIFFIVLPPKITITLINYSVK